MKLQVLFFNKYGHAQVVADKLSTLFRCKCDQIPPAYQCNKEKLVFIAYEKHGSFDKKFFDELKALFEKHGVHVAGTLGVPNHKGLFGKGKVKEEDMGKVLDFAKKLGEEMFESLRKPQVG